MAQVSESDYRTAQQGNAQTRQEFLDAIDLGDLKKLVMKTLYVDGNFSHNPDADMGCLTSHIPLVNEKNEKVFPALIAVFKKSFRVSYGVFKSTLIDHEGYHVLQNHRFPEAVRRIEQLIGSSSYEETPGLKSVLEIPAYLYQLNHAGDNILDPTFAPYLLGLPNYANIFLDAERNKPGRLMPLLRSVTDNEEFQKINEVLDNFRKLR